MKLMGAALVLLGGLGGFLLYRREARYPLTLGQALLDDLAVLRWEVCVRRAPLPALLVEELDKGAGAAAFWTPLAGMLADAPLARCWETAASALPEPLGRIMAPLGPLLGAGGEALARAIDEGREELTVYLRAQRQRQSAGERLAAGLCLSGACLLILVLI